MKFRDYYFLLLLLFLLTSTKRLTAQLVINEFSAANAAVLPDEFGKYGDWIEFYNSGNSALNLYKYKLSDDLLEPTKWQFPRVIVPAHGFLTVFADDTSKLTFVDHWETPAKSNDTWSYKTPNASTDTNWRNLSFNDAIWNRGKGGFGFGDGDDSTVVSNIKTIYIRKKITISDTSQVIKAIFNIDYDDGFAAYLNGVEIARSNLGTVGTRPAYSDYALTDHEAKMYQGQDPDSFYIDFNLLRKAIRNGTNVLAV
ncbi:MAG: lamin tail domain-containing protein, partial [Bacteroidota bacterium]